MLQIPLADTLFSVDLPKDNNLEMKVLQHTSDPLLTLVTLKEDSVPSSLPDVKRSELEQKDPVSFSEGFLLLSPLINRTRKSGYYEVTPDDVKADSIRYEKIKSRFSVEMGNADAPNSTKVRLAVEAIQQYIGPLAKRIDSLNPSYNGEYSSLFAREIALTDQQRRILSGILVAKMCQENAYFKSSFASRLYNTVNMYYGGRFNGKRFLIVNYVDSNRNVCKYQSRTIEYKKGQKMWVDVVWGIYESFPDMLYTYKSLMNLKQVYKQGYATLLSDIEKGMDPALIIRRYIDTIGPTYFTGNVKKYGDNVIWIYNAYVKPLNK